MQTQKTTTSGPAVPSSFNIHLQNVGHFSLLDRKTNTKLGLYIQTHIWDLISDAMLSDISTVLGNHDTEDTQSIFSENKGEIPFSKQDISSHISQDNLLLKQLKKFIPSLREFLTPADIISLKTLVQGKEQVKNLISGWVNLYNHQKNTQSFLVETITTGSKVGPEKEYIGMADLTQKTMVSTILTLLLLQEELEKKNL